MRPLPLARRLGLGEGGTAQGFGRIRTLGPRGMGGAAARAPGYAQGQWWGGGREDGWGPGWGAAQCPRPQPWLAPVLLTAPCSHPAPDPRTSLVAESWPSPRCQRQWQGPPGGGRHQGHSHPPAAGSCICRSRRPAGTGACPCGPWPASASEPHASPATRWTPPARERSGTCPPSGQALLAFWSLWAAGGSLPKPRALASTGCRPGAASPHIPPNNKPLPSRHQPPGQRAGLAPRISHGRKRSPASNAPRGPQARSDCFWTPHPRLPPPGQAEPEPATPQPSRPCHPGPPARPSPEGTCPERNSPMRR